MTGTTEQLKSGIERAVEAFGSQEAMARELGVTQQAVSSWVANGYVPVRRVVQIEALTGVPRADLLEPKLADIVRRAEDML